jgi:multiple RNA-binding domain-containing protein 1
MDGRDVEGHKLQIKASHKGADAAEERRKEDAAKKAASTKIIIKNLPFEAGVSSFILSSRRSSAC